MASTSSVHWMKSGLLSAFQPLAALLAEKGHCDGEREREERSECNGAVEGDLALAFDDAAATVLDVT